MRLSDHHDLDPDAIAELEAIDATLRGEAVDPAHAELAELALLLAAERPEMPADAAQSLDAAVARRFAAPRAAETAARGRPSARRWWLRPAFGGGLATLVAAAIVGVIVIDLHSLQNTPVAGSYASSSSASNGAVAASAPAHTATQRKAAAPGAAGTAGQDSQSVQTSLTPAPATPAGAPAASANVVPTPPSNGRKQIQSAQIQLTAPNSRINAVSQEVFSVVSIEQGIVKSSQITTAGGNGGYADFQLSIPSGNLSDAMRRLSALPYAQVASRTDQTQDVTGQYNGAVSQLAEARALRTSLLKQLAAAVTQTQVASIQAQLHDADAAIARDSAALGHLTHAIDYSNLEVTINAGPVIVAPQPSHGSSDGLTLGRAWHDAVRVLTVAAGVALIALAALLPLALIVALIVWIAYWVRRRRREAALDAV